MPRKRPETKRSKIVKLRKGLFLRNGQTLTHKKMYQPLPFYQDLGWYTKLFTDPPNY